MSTNPTMRLKTGLAEMLKGGVIMDVTTAEQAKIAENSGAVAVMAQALLMAQDFLVAALAASALRPPTCLQVPLATYFHEPLSVSTLDWPAQEWVPARLAQSFWPAFAMP